MDSCSRLRAVRGSRNARWDSGTEREAHQTTPCRSPTARYAGGRGGSRSGGGRHEGRVKLLTPPRLSLPLAASRKHGTALEMSAPVGGADSFAGWTFLHSGIIDVG